MPITSTTNALATITSVTNILPTITNGTNIYLQQQITTTDLSSVSISNLITETTAITSWSDPALWVTLGGIVFGGILSFLLYKVSKKQSIISADQYELLKFQQLDKDKIIIRVFQKDIIDEFDKLERDIKKTKKDISEIRLLPYQLSINDLICKVDTHYLNVFNRIIEEGFIDFTYYVKILKHSTFNENEIIYSYLKKLDKKIQKLRASESPFRDSSWGKCNNKELVLNKMDLYLNDFLESFRQIKDIALKSCDILSSLNNTKDDLNIIEEMYNKLKQLEQKSLQEKEYLKELNNKNS